MEILSKKIDFALIISVERANPNGDPLNGNRPRTDYEGFGEISDVCLKRKIRDRLMERYQGLPENKRDGQAVFVQSDDRKIDRATNLKDRAEKALLKEVITNSEKLREEACKIWFDVRTFGQLFAFKKSEKKAGDKKKSGKDKKDDLFDENSDVENADDKSGDTGISVGIRGPVTIQSAFSLEPISTTSIQITKSVNAESKKNQKTGMEEDGMSSDRMGMKHRVDKGIYVTYGSMNPQLAEKTGFSYDDAKIIKNILPKLFENDASSARPEGSMTVLRVIWWEHNCKGGQYSSAKVHKSLHVDKHGIYTLDEIDGFKFKPEEIPGF
jgi:CRISPR-associated protein Csd2